MLLIQYCFRDLGIQLKRIAWNLPLHSSKHIVKGPCESNEASLQNWQPNIDESAQWLKNGGCEIVIFDGPVLSYSGPGVNINGRLWNPSTLEFV